ARRAPGRHADHGSIDSSAERISSSRFSISQIMARCLQRRSMSKTSLLRIGCAAGFSGDRTDAAAPVVRALAESGGSAVLIFETLAERTLALAQLERRRQPCAGYEPLLDELLRPVLADCLAAGIRIVSNFGAANPPGAARRIHALAHEIGLPPPRVAVVEGDDVS